MKKALVIQIFIITGVSCLWCSISLENTPFWESQQFPVFLYGAHITEITNDNYPEIVTPYEIGYNYLYLNNHGVIDSMPRWQSSDFAFNVWPAFGDYDNDGDLDMAVACYLVPGGRTRVYRNDNGVLTREPVWIASVGGGTWCDWGDVDNDGDLDLAIVDMLDNPGVSRNDDGILGNTPFWRATDYNLDFGGAWLDVDVDNDGDLDLAVGGHGPSEPNLRIYHNNNGFLENIASWISQFTSDDYNGTGISPRDIDNDGWRDVGVSGGFTTAQKNIIYKNLRDTLESYPSWFSTDAFVSGRGFFGDVDGDGDFDWIVNNGKQNGGKGVVYENAGGNLNPTYAWFSAIDGGLGIDLGDVDQDGIKYKEDTVSADGTKKLFYLTILPIHKLVGIAINGDSVLVRDYCCNLKSGWVSFKNSIPAGSQIVFK